MTSMHTRQLMFDMTAHFVWLTAYILRPSSAHPDVLPPGEMVFRRRLAQQYPAALAATANMTVPDIVRVLLPVFERWLATARDALYY